MILNIRKNTTWIAILAASILFGMATYAVWPLLSNGPGPSAEYLQAASRQSFLSKDFSTALGLAEAGLDQSPSSLDLLMLAGTSSLELGDTEGSRTYYLRAAKLDGTAVANDILSIALGLRSRGKWELAEAALIQGMEIAPRNIRIGEQRGLLLAQMGKRWDAANVYRELLSRGVFSMDTLIFIANPELVIDKEKELERLLKIAPDDALLQLGNAYFKYQRGDISEAVVLLRSSLEKRPRSAFTHALLGKCLLVVSPEGLDAWSANLPSDADAQPEIWFVRSQWAKKSGNRVASIHCLLQTLLRDPGHIAATTELSQAISAEGETERSNQLASRALAIQELNGLASWVNESREDVVRGHEIIKLAGRLDRWTEVVAWCDLFLNSKTADEWVTPFRELANGKLAASNKPKESAADLGFLGIKLGNYPMPKLERLHKSTDANPSGEDPTVRFVEMTKQLGVDFEYFPGRLGPVQGRKMQEFTGGGVGVLDYDHDGWPDFYLAQGSVWPPPMNESDVQDRTKTDRLFRNRFGEAKAASEGSFTDQTAEAGIFEFRFGQGVSIGDLNSDGFDDIYVCNIGPNSLWINQGDGTFVDCSHWIPPQSEWTASAAIADVNGDGLADIFDVNYVKGKNVYELICANEGRPTACGPSSFEQSPDRLLISSGFGPMLDSSESTLSGIPAGNGLGISVFRLPDHSDLSIYIANDANPNVLLELTKDQSKSFGFQMQDTALVRGVALDASGKAEGSMGIAVGDAQGDGLLDLFVTNVFHEHFTLYLQQDNGVFVDETAKMGVMKPTYELLGFGTQFLDVQLDGYPDLLAINGDVDDLSQTDRPFRMPPTLLKNERNLGFRLLPGSGLGDYFKTPQVGRSLALIDFDRDGKMDFISTCLEGKAAAVRNATHTSNHFVKIQLIATKSERTAIGTMVEVTSGESKWKQQLTAGNGYMASNERTLSFGVGQVTEIEEIVISWPSGQTETVKNVSVDSSLVFIEGGESAFSSIRFE